MFYLKIVKRIYKNEGILFMSFYDSDIYINDLKIAIESVINIDKLKNSSIMITGAAGLIGSYIIDMLQMYNRLENADIKIYALSRTIGSLKLRFDEIKTNKLEYITHDVNDRLENNFQVDYIIHAASNAYPAAFNIDPVGTVMSNVQGTKNILDYGKSQKTKRVLFVSSGEVYGQGDIQLDDFDESYCGYIDSMKSRSCYPNSKRMAETLCCSYTKQYSLDTVVRPCHSYGPNATVKDNRANVQFINSAISGKDIILKSAGNQLRSYCYISDTASAILTVLLNGKSCEAYNIAVTGQKITVAGFANIIAERIGCKVIFTNPDDIALAEQTPIVKQVLNSKKLEQLGWMGKYSIKDGIYHTLDILLGK